MHVIICTFFLILVSWVDAASLNNVVQDDEGEITFDIDVEKKTYSYRLETPDDTIQNQEGHFEIDPSTGEESLVVEGGYEYTGDNGMQYSVTYTADKNGYRPYVAFGTRFGGYAPGGYAPGGGTPRGGAGPPGTPGPPGKGLDLDVYCALAGTGCK